jgi:hypothetical protein
MARPVPSRIHSQKFLSLVRLSPLCVLPFLTLTSAFVDSLVSISPIFYKQPACTKVFCATFMCLQFGFVIFWQKDFDAKAVHNMLVKLTPWPNDIKLFTMVIYCHSMVILSFFVMKQHYLGNYCRMAVFV